MELRNGFNGSDPQTLVEVGQKFGLTNESVRQIEAKAIREIREFSDIEELAVYMDSLEHAIENIDEYKKLYNHKRNKVKKLKSLEY